MMAQRDLLVVGDIDVDIYLRVPRLPEAGEKVRGQLIGLRPGGVAANVAVAARRLGLVAGVHGVVGADEHGTIARSALQGEGVDLSAVVVDRNATTFLCVVHLDASGEKALTLADTGCLFPSREQLDVAALQSAARVHVAPFDLEVAAYALELAAVTGARTSVDLEPGSIGGGLDDVAALLHHVEVCVVNHHAARELSPTGDPLDALVELHARGPGLVVMTAGNHGATVSIDGRRTHVPGMPVEVVDSTGAGDAFCAALLSELHHGSDPVAAARAGVVAGALACRAVGAQAGAPTRDELNARLAGPSASQPTAHEHALPTEIA